MELFETVQQSFRVDGGESRVHQQLAFGLGLRSQVLRLC
jgi:hypothetical protein